MTHTPSLCGTSANLASNRHAVRAPYPPALQSLMSVSEANRSARWLRTWSQLNPLPTPLHEWPGAAKRLGVRRLAIKDESVRSGLGSFKTLGAPVALLRLVQRLFPHVAFDPGALFNGAHAGLLRDFTVISATDGNHGRALAAAARTMGCRCVVVIHANVSIERETAIAGFGAEVIRITGNYDESVEHAAALAKKMAWHVVSDTSYEGYQDIPRDVMQGYGTIAEEVIAQAGKPAFTHVFLQGGVGGMAAGLASYFWESYGENRPVFVVVEPGQADCLFQSALSGEAAKATGSVDSVMAGLACGETSPLAWRFLKPSIDFFQTIDDEDAVSAMRLAANPFPGDIPIVAGESGAAGLAGLMKISGDSAAAKLTGLNGSSSVLCINTEGATAPLVYSGLAGQTAGQVLARQQALLAA